MFAVTDGRGGVAEQAFQVRTQAQAGNYAPTIISEATTSAYISKTYTYDVDALDADNDVLTYSLVQAPEGMTIDARTGIISWTTPVVGQQDVTVQVQDSRGGVDVQSFTLNTSDVVPGVISGRVYVDNRQSGSIIYFNDFEDPNRSLDEWSNALRDVTPLDSRHFLGRYGGSAYDESFRQTRLTLNDLPEHETVTLSFKLYVNDSWNGSTGWYSPDTWKLNVVDGPTLLYTTFGSGYPYGLPQAYPNNFDESNPYFNLNPSGTGASETNTLGYYLTDIWGDAVYNLTFTFEHNGNNLAFDFIGGTDEDINNESWSLDDVEVTVGSSLKGLANWSVYLDNNNNGQYDLDELSTLTDDQGNYSFTVNPGAYTVAQEIQTGWTQTRPATTNYQITVNQNQTVSNFDFSNRSGVSENVAPTFINTPPTQVMIGQKFNYRSVATDLNGDVLSYELVVKPEGMLIDTKTGLVSWKPTTEQLGVQNVVVRVSDGFGGVDLQSFQVQVLPFNQAPVFTNVSNNLINNYEDLIAEIDSPINYQFSAIDPDGDAIIYSLKQAPSGVSLDSSNGILTWTPDSSQIRLNSLLITATDSKGAETTINFDIRVVASLPNSAPIISSTPRTTISIGQSYLYGVQASDSNKDLLTYSLETAPAGMTIDSSGRIFWQPQASQLGSQHVTLNVSDGRGGIATQSFDINVVSAASYVNNAPTITSAPNLITNLDRAYEYNLAGSDPDGDLLFWSLDNAPVGMVIDSQTGALRWNPTSTQIGEHTVAVRLTDAYGLYVGQEFTLIVTGVNAPPQIVSAPVTRAALNQTYTYTVIANDPENDALTFSLGRAPAGMTIDSNGTVRWTPQASQVGQQEVEVLVTDEQGAVTSQIYTIEVGTNAINHAPSITSTPVYVANVGSAYQYQVQATDPDAGDRLTYQLLSVPAGVTGITIDAATGLLTWQNPVAGNYRIVVGAVDDGGLGAAQGFTLTARANNAPVIRSTPVLTATPGSAYGYDIIASDVDGDRLTYTLDQASLNKGITLDTLGRLRWNPTTSNVGTHRIVLTVSDGITSTPQQYDLVVAADTEAPKVRLIANYDTVDLGGTVTFQARATDNIKVAGLQLLVNGNAVVLDANGMGRYTPTTAGTIFAKAIATDTAGNIGQATFDVAVIDTSDVDAPEVSLNLGVIAGSLVTAPIDIRGSISDDGQLDYYKLLVAPVAGGAFREIAFVDNPTAIANGVLGKFDPSLLQNDSYILRLEVADNGGHVSYAEEVVDVAGELKLGNFRLSFTDLTVPVTGIPITLTRTYDTLTSGITDDFGYGWRMEFRDTDLRTSLRPPSEEEQLLGYQSAFKDGTRVYITLPGGKREAFTFRPTVDPIFGLASAIGGVNSTVYKPAFVGDKGVTSTLTVKSARILRKDGTDEYVGLNGGLNYNPADVNFGNVYVLTTKEGIVYEIDAQTGDLLTVTDTNGNKLTYTDDGIYSSSGKQVTFERDAQGRIAAVKDPMGELIRYTYDAKGDLVSVKDQEQFETRFIYDGQRSHYLKEIIDPLNRTGAKVEYGDDGRLKKTLNATGNSVEIDYDPANSLQTVKDVLGNPTTYEYDTRGNVVRVVDALGNQTRMVYDDNNNLLQVTDANNLVTKYEYDDKGNLKSRTEQYCGCATVTPGTSYYTYDKFGNMTSLVTPTGASMTMKYDSYGQMLSMKDGKGNLIQSFSYYANGLVRSETDSTGTTVYEYDDFGNVIQTTDPDGSITTMEYYADGMLKRMVEDNGTPNDTSDDEISTFEYDKLGREKFADYGNGIWVKYDYEGAGGDWTKLEAPTIGKIERKLTADGKLAGWVTADGGTPTFKYDLAGRLWRETDASGNDVTEYSYDAAGRVTSVKDLQTGATTSKKYDAGGRVIEEVDTLKVFTRYNYNTRTGRLDSTESGKYLTNALGNLILDANNNPIVDTTVEIRTYRYEYNGLQTTVIDPLERRTTTVSDDYYLPKETIYQLRDGSKFSEKTEYLYASNLQEAKDYPTRVVDIGSNDRVFEYDELGRLKSATDLGDSKYLYTYGDDGLELITSPTGETLRYGYDALGNLAKVTYGDGKFEQMTYNAVDNRLETVTLPSGETITYDYDDAGRVRSQTSSTSGSVSFTYTAEGAVKTMTDNTGTTTYRYDTSNRLEGMDYANGSSISYTYDIVGRIKTLTEKGSATTTAYTTEYDYDAFGNLSWVKDPAGGITTMKYDVVNRLQERTLPNGVKTTYEYDDLDRIKSIAHTNAQGQVLASVTYEREGIGEPSKITREDNSYVLLEYDSALRVEKESYYNAAGQLLNETSYSYDASGKRQVQSTSTGDRTFNYTAGYQLDTVTEAGETENYDYDTDGRLTLIERDGKTLDLNHDAYDRLTSVENETTGQTTQYVYDGAGNRVKAIEETQERRFLVAPAMSSGLQSTDLITDGSGNLISNYIYGGGSSPFMRLDANGNAVYYLTDAMGSVIGLADGSGASSGKFLYDAFGNILSQIGGADSDAGGDFRFQGQWLESESGFYHFRARDYDPATGLFLSRDPVDIIETAPESFNPYQFVYNNPYVYSDPTGMFSLVELNVSEKIQKTLDSIRNNATRETLEWVKDKVSEIIVNQIYTFLQQVIPGSDRLQKALNAGDKLESFLIKGICNLVSGQPDWLSNLWNEVPISPRGIPLGNGFNCNARPGTDERKEILTTDRGPTLSDPRNRRGYSVKPDLLFKNSPPLERQPKALLIGDVKINLNRLHEDYISPGNRRNQWETITRYAKSSRRMYVPATLYIVGRNGTQREKSDLDRLAITRGVILFLLPILPRV
ncbi:putative Ig domain-containing protein [Nostoc sp. FACHB-190]|uniref:putative Ig domain-containing protein n=1 Tax=Nostoc sp. FACHB-190 TaxID=2692838 RepID=UPI001A7EF030|nr:putative Ig domain-containing protein [Nostoc sp. FACHB-190]